MIYQEFVEKFKDAFPNAKEPLAFGYCKKEANNEKVQGCMFKGIHKVLHGELECLTLSLESIKCPGGKAYSGFDKVQDFVYGFVSEKEKYLETPSTVRRFVEDLDIPKALDSYLFVKRLSNVSSQDLVEGVMFFGTPDVLSGLFTWASYDFPMQNAIQAPFGSGCSSTFTQTIKENQIGGAKCFIGLFDPSVREFMDPSHLSFSIPTSRFKKMLTTFDKCCVGERTRSWNIIRERM